MWLVGVAVRRYIDIHIIIITFPYSTCISSFFWQQHPYFFVHFKMFFHSLYIPTKLTSPLALSAMQSYLVLDSIAPVNW